MKQRIIYEYQSIYVELVKIIDFAMELAAFELFVQYIVHVTKGAQGIVKELIIAGWLGERFLKRKLNITKRTNTMDDRAKSIQYFA